MILDEYLEYQKKYETKYGDNTIVLMEVGMFYELYGVNNSNEVLGKVPEISDLLNIQMSRKNKNIIENNRSNPLMAGVPNHSIKKYISILLNHNWTVVLIEQSNVGSYIERKVSNIYSPGTSIECNEHIETNNLLSIYLEGLEQLNNTKTIYVAGISVIDVSTGKNMIYQINSIIDDRNLCLDEIYRFINIHNPREIIIHTKNLDLTKEDLIRYLEIDNRINHIFYDDLDSNMFKLSYQNEFLEKIFPNYGLLTVIEYLDLERYNYGIISYLYLLRFAQEHNESVIQRIHKPIIWDKNKYLLLSHSSIYQLNLVSSDTIDYNNSRYKSLFNVINLTQTVIGKRLLKEQLLNPIVDKTILEERYNYIDILLQDDLYKTIDDNLSSIRDIERLHRKLSLKILPPCDFYTLDISYRSILNILDIVETNDLKTIIPIHIELFRNYIQEYRNIFNLEEIVKYNFNNITNSFYNSGIVKEVDEIQLQIKTIKDFYQQIIVVFSKLIDDNNENCLKLEHNEHYGYYISLTSKRCKKLQDSLKKMKQNQIIIGDVTIDKSTIQFDTRNSSVKLLLDIIGKKSNQLLQLQENIRKYVYDYYISTLETLHTKYNKALKEVVRFVGEIDVITNNAKVAKKYRYCRPKMSLNSNSDIDIEHSYLKATSLRHPIIEQIEDRTEYISNDITLGIDHLDGILLYGVNASGKSSLMKSVGLSIIMAQAGMFVPCYQFEYEPYHNLFTRISNNDNIFKGQSTFAVEMSELRSILKRTNNKSLVLGDELCSGTEWISGQSIVAAGIIYLSKKNTSFIFATHMHQLIEIDEVKQLSNIQYKHLKVNYNYQTGKLVYDRKITDGIGSSTYGLEVCKAMDLENQFLDIANNIRHNYFHKKTIVTSPKSSHFNQSVYMDICKICQKPAEDVHHIKYQSQSDTEGYIGFYHQNVRHNLVPLCKQCHLDTHHNKLDIYGYIKSSHGVELDYKYNNDNLKQTVDGDTTKRKKKVNDTQIDIIKELQHLPNINQQKAVDIMKSKHQLQISIGIVSKIWNNKY